MLKEKLKTNNKINANTVGAGLVSARKKINGNKSNANAVGADDPVCPLFEEPTQNKNLISNLQPLTSDYKGITLIALIITIIVMLILVGVTINVALNGGLFSKAESAVTQTKIEQVKEALEIKKAEILAENDGEKPKGGYDLNIDKLDIPDNLKNEYGDKLTVGKDGNLYYDPAVVKDTNEQNLFKAHGINELGSKKNSYTFTIGELVERGLLGRDRNGNN